jgi:hypothetical protein
VFAIQNWLGESKEPSKSQAAQPAIFSVGMSCKDSVLLHVDD